MKREKPIGGERTMSKQLNSNSAEHITTIVWHNTHQVPTKEQPVLYVTKNSKIAVFNRVNIGDWD